MLLSSFRYTPGLHFITPPFVTLHSSISINLSNPRKRNSFSSFRSPFPRSISPQLWLSTPQLSTQAKTLGLHCTLRNSLHSVQSLPLPFPVLFSGMPCKLSYPKKKIQLTLSPLFKGNFCRLQMKIDPYV